MSRYHRLARISRIARSVGLALLLPLALAAGAALGHAPRAEARPTENLLLDAEKLHGVGQYFKAARYAFAAQEQDRRLSGAAYAWITLSLARANLHHSAAYFFIRTLQTGEREPIRRVLAATQDLFVEVGPSASTSRAPITRLRCSARPGRTAGSRITISALAWA